MAISFEDAVDEILTGKKKSITEASISNKLNKIEEKINLKKILSEKEDLEQQDLSDEKEDDTIKDRIKDKKEDDSKEAFGKDKEEEAKNKEKQNQRQDYYDLIADDKEEILRKDFNVETKKSSKDFKPKAKGEQYKITREPTGPEALRIYVRKDSENVNIKAYELAKAKSLSSLESVLNDFGLTYQGLEGYINISEEGNTVDNAINPTEKATVSDFTIVIAKVVDNISNMSLKIFNNSVETIGMQIAGGTTTKKQALEIAENQYLQTIYKSLSSSEREA